MTSADLVGRFLLKGGDTVWVDGPLTRAVRTGAVFYLDEIVEARQDTTVVIHARIATAPRIVRAMPLTGNITVWPGASGGSLPARRCR